MNTYLDKIFGIRTACSFAIYGLHQGCFQNVINF